MNPTITELTDFTTRVLTAVGLSDTDASSAAEVLVTSDAMGVFTHGTKSLSGYVKKLQAGGYRADADPVVEREGPAWAVVDGQSALGMIGCQFCIDLAMQKAGEVGVAYVGLRNTGHIGAAGYYTQKAARRGFIAMVTGSDVPTVAAPGSLGAVLGSNPIAYGVPVPGGDPINLDIATAAVAGGKILAAHQRGEPISPEWMVGPDGRPTTDGSLFPHRAALAPMAGHKGYGFGLWCEFLSGILPGGRVTWEIGNWMFGPLDQPTGQNAGFIVLDVGAIADADVYAERIHHLVDEIHNVSTAEGIERVVLPGEFEWARVRAAEVNGIPLPQDVREKLSDVVELAGERPAWLAGV